jgi:hypothetical protein
MYNNQIWNKFLEKVGWIKKEKGRGFLLWREEGRRLSLAYSEFTFDLEMAPHAHLPALVYREGPGWGSSDWSCSLLSRKDF